MSAGFGGRGDTHHQHLGQVQTAVDTFLPQCGGMLGPGVQSNGGIAGQEGLRAKRECTAQCVGGCAAVMSDASTVHVIYCDVQGCDGVQRCPSLLHKGSQEGSWAERALTESKQVGKGLETDTKAAVWTWRTTSGNGCNIVQFLIRLFADKDHLLC